jgi:PAS domain S-box-containing protein
MHNKKLKSSLRNKLMVWILVLSLTPLIGVSLVSYFQYSKNLINKAAIELHNSSNFNKLFIDNWFSFRFKDIQAQAQNLSNIYALKTLNEGYQNSNLPLKGYIKSNEWSLTTKEIQHTLMKMKDNYDYIHDIFLIDNSSNILFSIAHESDLGTNLQSGLFKNTRFSSTVLKSIQSQKAHFSGVERYAPSNDQLSAFFTSPLTNEQGNPIGIIAIQIKLDSIYALFESTEKHEMDNEGKNKRFNHYLVDSEHVLQTPIDNQWQNVLHKTMDAPLLHTDKMGTQIPGSPQITEYVNSQNKKTMAVVDKVNILDTEWILVTETPVNLVLQEVNWLAKTISILIILFVITIIFIVLSNTKKITAPLATLTKASIKAASSNENIHIKETTNDEIGQLTSSFNYMITKRNTYLKEIKHNNHKMALILENTGAGFWDYDIAKGTLQCTAGWYDMMGYSEEDLVPFTDTKYINLIHPEDVGDAKYLLYEHIKDQSNIYNIQFRIKQKSGNWIWVQDKGSVVERNEEHIALRAIGTITNITEQKIQEIEQEKSFKATQIKLKISKLLNQEGALKDRLNNAIAVCFDLLDLSHLNQGGIFVLPTNNKNLSSENLVAKFSRAFINQSQQESLGSCLVDLPTNITDIVTHSHCSKCLEDHDAVQQTSGDNHGHYIIPLTHSSANQTETVGVLFFYTSINPEKTESLFTLLNEIGSLFTVTIVQDQAKNLLEEANVLAKQSNDLKGEFLASMSHEIRTPMNGVLGMLDLLMSSGLNEDQKQKALLAQSSAESLLVLINDILDFSKIEAGKMDLDEYDFNLITMLGEFSKTIAFNAQEKGLELILDTNDVTNQMIKGDQGRIRQILTNLVGNAIKFTHQGEVLIRVHVKPVEQNKLQLICSIEDTGIGIPEEKLSTLFNSFSQVDASTTRIYGGTGLGLTISKNLCELMNGQVVVTSKIDEGSKFEFTLLLQESEKDVTVDVPQHFNALNILIVDDNQKTSSTVKASLSNLGVTAYILHSGEEVIDWCDKVKTKEKLPPTFDAIFIDSQMPSMNGKKLAISLNNIPEFSNIPKVMMTAISEHYDEDYYKELKVCSHFSKPIAHQDLISTLNFIVEKKLGNNTNSNVSNSAANSVNEKEINPTNDSTQEDQWPDDYRILLVEDNKINQVVAQGVLKRFHLKADVANNGLEALDTLKDSVNTKPFTIILMDCQMPEMDGYQATQEIRRDAVGEAFSNIPIIAMTANAMDGDKERCIEAGMDDYLTKPINPMILEQKLHQWLNEPEKTRENMAKLNDKAKEDKIIEDKKEQLKQSSTQLDTQQEKQLKVDKEQIDIAADTPPLLIWNEQDCLQRVSDNTELLKIFIDESPDTMQKIEATILSIEEMNQRDSSSSVDIALDEENTKALCQTLLKLAHLIKGLTGNLSADQFYQLASLLEQHSRNENLEKIIQSKQNFLLAHDNLMKKLNDYISQ